MSWFLAVLFTGVGSFVATNIDDLIILMLFFSQVGDRFRPRHIIIGQYLGFTALIIASLPGLLGGFIIPRTWIKLLGLVPIIIGIAQLLSPKKEETIQTVSSPSNISVNKKIFRFFSSQTYGVAMVAIANGGDNIGIYIPLFASRNLLSFGITLSLFYILIGLWCLIAYLLTFHSSLGKFIASYGNAIAPFVLIGLGIYIFIN